MSGSDIGVSVVLPCRNEQGALGWCLENIKRVFRENDIEGEIIVSDSSVDRSPEIARKHGVKLVKHDKEGYGIAYLEGFREARGKYIFMGDCDGTYDFSEIPRFVKYLDEGYDMVIGNRFTGKINDGAMPWLHKYIGNPILSGILRVFFGAGVRDAHCGMRAIKRDKLERLNLRTSGMEFASEMVIKALKNGLKIKELPIDYNPRKGESKLHPFRDGWRHLRFMLLYSPLYLFFIPGLLMSLIGSSSMIWIYFSNAQIWGVKLYYHPMFLSSLLMILGYQLIFFAAFAKTYAVTHLGERSSKWEGLYKYVTIEKAGIVGIIIALLGIGIYIMIFGDWAAGGFGELSAIKGAIIGMTLMILGAQTLFSAFMLSILGIRER